MGLFQTKTIEMAAMAVLNHTEEDLDDDIVSNLSLNLMVSDNEDGGSPNSDRFDKLESQNESPEDSNNCDNNKDTKTNCDNLFNEMKDDLQQLRDITGDSSWSAVDEADDNEFTEDKEILKETENKAANTIDTECILGENHNREEDYESAEEANEDKKSNIAVSTEEESDKCIVEDSNPDEKCIEEDSNPDKESCIEDSNPDMDKCIEDSNTDKEMCIEEDSTPDKQSTACIEEESMPDKQSAAKESAVKDVEMEDEERLLNDIKDNEKDSYDCENFDEDALLSDARDEDLLQITEEKSTENDTADFLKSCQEEQEANDNSSSSTEKADDNQFDSASEYEESNNDLIEPDVEPDCAVSSDNYENSYVDNDASDINMVKSQSEEEPREEGAEEYNNVNDKINEEEPQQAGTEECGNKGYEINEEEPQKKSTEECGNINDEISDAHIIESEDSSLQHEDMNEPVKVSSVENLNTSVNSILHKVTTRDASDEHIEVSKSIDETSDKIKHFSDPPVSLSYEAHDTEESSKTDKGAEIETTHNALETSSEMNTTLDTHVDEEPSLCEVDASTKKITITNITSCDEGPIQIADDIQPSKSAETALEFEERCSSSVMESFSKSNTISDLGSNLSEANNLPSESVPNDGVSIEIDEVEQILTLNNTIVGAHVEEEVVAKTDTQTHATECITKANEISKHVDSMPAIANVDDKVLEIDDETMEVDDMELDAEPTALPIENNILSIENHAPCINKQPVVIESSGEITERTHGSKTVNVDCEVVVEDKTDATTVQEKDTITFVDLMDNTAIDTTPAKRNMPDDIINLIDDTELEIIAEPTQTDNSKLQKQIADAPILYVVEAAAQSNKFTNNLNVETSSGIEGDNKECEDMDIEEITPYKEPAARPNGSVLKQMLVNSSTLPSTSPLVSLPSTDGKQNAKRLSNTIADNNIAVVSPQPGDKRLSSDHLQLENAKRRRLVSSEVMETRQKYLESFKQAMSAANWSKIGRRQLEEFVTQKILETIHYKTDMGQLHKKCKEYKQSLENLRTNSLTLTKQLRDMNAVHIKLEREITLLKARQREDDKPLVAVKITRSVGLQALVEDPKVQRRSRSINTGGAARTTPQKPPSQVIHQPQQQLQKPIHQPQKQPLPAQTPQRVAVTVSAPPQLQARPARPLASLPTVASPVQTRTMSRNKKIPASNMVTTTNPPPLRPVNQQQSSTGIGATLNIPITHMNGPTLLNKTVNIPIQSVVTPIIATATKDTSKGVIDLTDEDDVGKKMSPIKTMVAPPQQQRITLMSTVVNGQQVLLRVDGGGPLPSKAATAINNFVQSSPAMLQQRTAGTNLPKVMAGVPLRTRNSSNVQTATPQPTIPNAQPPTNTSPSPNNVRRFRHPAPLPAPPASQSLIKGNKPIPPKPTVTVSKSSNGIIVKWNMPSMLSLFEKIIRYELFVYQVTKSPPRTDSWGKINDVGALDLPMAVSLTEFAEGNRYYFAVRAVDELGRLGPFSEPQTIVF